MYEAESQHLISIFGEANRAMPMWLPFLKPEEVGDLMDAAATIQRAKTLALERQKQKIG